MLPKAAGTFSSTLKFTFAASGSLATAMVPVAATAAPVGQPAHVDPARWADAFNGWSVGFGSSFDYFHDAANVDAFGGTAQSPNLSGGDPFAHFEIGRDFRANNYVFGLYGDIFAGEQSSSFASSGVKSPSGTLKLQAGGSVTARAGVMPNQGTLYYGLAGWTWQHYAATLVKSAFSDSFNLSESGFLNGPTVGAGVEMLFPNNPDVSLKVEYRYTHLDAPGTFTHGGEHAAFSNIDDHSLRLMLSFKMP